MINIFLSGCLGRMGRTIHSIVQETKDLAIAAGSDISTQADCGFPVYQDPRQCREAFDVLIDFSSPAALAPLLDLIRQRQCPAIICTTGLSQEQNQALVQLSEQAPIFQSANMSLGINILTSLARQAAGLLYPDFDIEIIEAHHNQKVDAPSGTALMLADQIKDRIGKPVEYVYDRSPQRQPRKKTEIGLHAIRGGNIAGDHTILFAGPEETLSLQHHAQSRAVFARGALAAARFMAGKRAGFYNMEQLVMQVMEESRN